MPQLSRWTEVQEYVLFRVGNSNRKCSCCSEQNSEGSECEDQERSQRRVRPVRISDPKTLLEGKTGAEEMARLARDLGEQKRHQLIRGHTRWLAAKEKVANQAASLIDKSKSQFTVAARFVGGAGGGPCVPAAYS